MKVTWSKAQRQDLDWARSHHPVAHIRVRAVALWNVSQGHSSGAMATCVRVTWDSLRAWIRRFDAEGLAGLAVRPGRGRPSRVNPTEVVHTIEQSPRAFGLAQERWTLAALRQAVPSLRSLRSLRSVGYVMARTSCRGAPSAEADLGRFPNTAGPHRTMLSMPKGTSCLP